MSRCGICDYTPDDGSALLDKSPNSSVKVEWHSKYNGFLCTDCRKSVAATVTDYVHRDFDTKRISSEDYLSKMTRDKPF